MRRVLKLDHTLDMRAILGPLRHGPYDPTIRITSNGMLRATHTPEGPATLRLIAKPPEIDAEAWGPGAGWVLDRAADLLGLNDEPAAFRPADEMMRRLQQKRPGLRMCRSLGFFEALLPFILEQKVTSEEAHASYSRVVTTLGTTAPGPGTVRLPPTPERMAELPYYVLHPFGIEERRARTIKVAAGHANKLEGLVEAEPDIAMRTLRAIPGIGPWTASHVVQAALGAPDVVVTCDYHMHHNVCWSLAGERRGTDERMLQLLEPYRGQRGRAQRLILLSGIGPPTYGIKRRIRSIASI